MLKVNGDLVLVTWWYVKNHTLVLLRSSELCVLHVLYKYVRPKSFKHQLFGSFSSLSCSCWTGLRRKQGLRCSDTRTHFDLLCLLSSSLPFDVLCCKWSGTLMLDCLFFVCFLKPCHDDSNIWAMLTEMSSRSVRFCTSTLEEITSVSGFLCLIYQDRKWTLNYLAEPQ